MFFRNLTLFRFPEGLDRRFRDFNTLLSQHELRPCGPLEMQSRGWVSPYGRGESMFAVELQRRALIALGGEDKILPGSIVNQRVANKAAEIEIERGTPVGNRERRQIRDGVLNELLPQALCRPSRLPGYLDFDAGWVVVDTSSHVAASAFVSAIRNAIGSFPAIAMQPEDSPRAVMTEWLIDGKLPEGWALGDECVLKDPADRGAIVRCSRQDMGADEVREHLSAGKQVTALALVFEERMRFVLDDTMAVRKFKLLDIATEQLDKGDRASAKAELDARFVLMSGEIARLVAAIETTFGVPRPVVVS